MLGHLVAGGTHDPSWPSWLVAVVLTAFAGLLLTDHVVSRRTGRNPWRGNLFSGGPWYWHAIFFAFAGCGTTYNAVTNGGGWWLLSLVAWFGFVWMVVGRPG